MLNFFRLLGSALVVALLGAIVLGGIGGGAGISLEVLAKSAANVELANVFRFVFRFVFLAAALVLGFALAFLIAMEERALRGPVTQKQTAPAPAPATPITPEPEKYPFSCRSGGLGEHCPSLFLHRRRTPCLA